MNSEKITETVSLPTLGIKAGSYEEVKKIAPMPANTNVRYSPFNPPYRDIKQHFYGVFNPYLMPYEVTGWRDEQLSWVRTCYIHAGLSFAPVASFKGPDATKFLRKFCANTFDNFEVGTGKHCITCDENGIITSHGMLFKVAENEYETYFMLSLTQHAKFEGHNYDMTVHDLSEKKYLFQIGGPRCLELLEKVTGDDLHDVKFQHFRNTSIGGKQMRIARLGMSGTLSYELHGDVADAYEVYHAIYQAGQEFGVRRLGWHSYMMQHTLGGFPQTSYHFTSKIPGYPDNTGNVLGSAGSQASGYTDPFSLGWGFCVKFDHDFVGRPVLEKLAAENRRGIVSLEWNEEDILKIYASQFTDDPYEPIDQPNDMAEDYRVRVHQDRVLNADGKDIGISSGRTMSLYYRKMISLCQLDREYMREGTEVFVLWGAPGTKQTMVRAKVTRFPYVNENRNNSFDVERIPRINK